MNRLNSKSFIFSPLLLALALGAVVLPPPPQAYAFGSKKPAQPSAEDMQVQELLTLAKTQQKRINELRATLGLAAVPTPVVPHDPKIKIKPADVMVVIRKQQEDLATLDRQLIERDRAHVAADAERERIKREANEAAAKSSRSTI